MVRALIVGLLVSLCAALLGVSLVLKRYSMIGDGLSHVGFGALAVATALGMAPMAVTIPVVVAAAFLLLRLSSTGRLKGDAAIAMISTGALAVGVIVLSLSTGMTSDVNNYLFGSMLAMSGEDVTLSVVLAAAVLMLFVLFYRRIFAVTFDETFARATGGHAEACNMLLALLTAEPVEPMPLIEGIALVIGAQAVGSTIAPDYHRFCRNRKGSCLAAVVGIMPYCLFLFIAGAIMGAATGETDISILVAKLGLPFIGLAILVLATWTTMACDAYTGGLAITSLLHLSGTKRAAATGIAGVAGILLAVFGIMDYFTSFLDLMASCIPPVAGVMIADYWLLGRGKPENWKERKGIHWVGVGCLVLGVLAALFLPFGLSTINGVVVSGVAYFLIMKLAGKSAAAA